MASPIDALITTLENIVLVENKSSCIKWSRFKSDAQKERYRQRVIQTIKTLESIAPIVFRIKAEKGMQYAQLENATAHNGQVLPIVRLLQDYLFPAEKSTLFCMTPKNIDVAEFYAIDGTWKPLRNLLPANVLQGDVDLYAHMGYRSAFELETVLRKLSSQTIDERSVLKYDLPMILTNDDYRFEVFCSTFNGTGVGIIIKKLETQVDISNLPPNVVTVYPTATSILGQ